MYFDLVFKAAGAEQMIVVEHSLLQTFEKP